VIIPARRQTGCFNKEGYLENPFFFSNGAHKLFGVLYEPRLKSQTGLSVEKVGIVFCDPFAEEKLISQRVMVNLARALAADGYYVLRFDYMGHGDSAGNFEDATVESNLGDIRRAIEHLRENLSIARVGLVGVRFGATLAAVSAASNSAIDFLILIAPIVKGDPYIEQCLRSNLTTQMTVYRTIQKTREQLISDLMNGELVNIDGYLLGKDMYLQIKELNLEKQCALLPNKTLICQISRNERQPVDKSLEQLCKLYHEEKNTRPTIHNLVTRPFWAESPTYISKVLPLQNVIREFLKDLG
jgi:exosortase A-associated hydrolase 2